MAKITYSTRLLLNESNKRKLIDVLTAARLVWNECSKVQFTLPKNSIVELHDSFYRKFRDNNPNIPAQVVICSQRSVLSTYRTIKSNRYKIDKPVVRKVLCLQLDKNSISYKDGTFSIISLGSRVKCKPYVYPKLQEYLSRYKFGGPKIFERDGDVWISLTFDIPTILPQSDLAVGVDLGCRINAATSEGNLYVDKKFNGEKRRLRYLKRCLNRAKSKGSRKAKKSLDRLRHKERNKNRNFTHNLAKRIIEDTKADYIVLENLKSIKVKRNRYKKQNRISQISLYQLKEILTYKAHLYEKQVITVSPSFTSQIDCQTGKKDGVRQGRRYYSSTGKIYDSDWNAAINIAVSSKHPASLGRHKAIGTYGQATVNTPIVR